jgi:hypothetical protein
MTQHTFKFDLPIWKVLYDTANTNETEQYLAIELRDKQRVKWVLIDIDTNEIIWQTTPTEIDWWTTLSHFDGLYLTLNCYSGTNEPTASKKIMIGKLTGKIMPFLPEYTHQNRDNIHRKNLIQYSESDNYYNTLSQFIEKWIGQKPQNEIFYGEIAGNIILVYYFCSLSTSSLSPFLLVVSSQKVILLHKSIDMDSDGLLSESCIYNQNQFIYLSGLNELAVLKFF